MTVWLLVGILALVELAVVMRIQEALFRGSVPLNPAGWFGYSEFLELTVDRQRAPAVYWLVLVLVTLLAVVFGYLIYLVAQMALAA